MPGDELDYSLEKYPNRDGELGEMKIITRKQVAELLPEPFLTTKRLATQASERLRRHNLLF